MKFRLNLTKMKMIYTNSKVLLKLTDFTYLKQGLQKNARNEKNSGNSEFMIGNLWKHVTSRVCIITFNLITFSKRRYVITTFFVDIDILVTFKCCVPKDNLNRKIQTAFWGQANTKHVWYSQMGIATTSHGMLGPTGF